MIASFRHKGLKELYQTGRTSKVNQRLCPSLLMLLDQLNAILEPDDCLGLKGFHQLRGVRRGTYSMKVTANWRLTFAWDGESVVDVDLEDYH